MDDSEGYRHIRKDRRGQRPKMPEAWAAAYISLRRALGFRTAKLETHLRELVEFMRARGLASFDRLDRSLALVWLHSGSPQEGTIQTRLVSARSFFRYLLGLGAAAENVWDSLTAPRSKQFVPYIFSLAELRTILGHVRGRIDPQRLNLTRVHAAYHVMFHTLYACGLRAGEVCRLKMKDVDFERSLFVVRQTKFGKTRLVPFNSRTRELVVEYLDRFRPTDGGVPPEAPLFLNYRRRPFSTWAVGAHLPAVCKAVGIYRHKQVKRDIVHGATNVHALRHTFAVHRLLKWYEEGADVNAKLPLLATYMGHAHYRHTQWYLTVLPRFTDIAGKLFADRFERPLKDLEWPADP